MILTYDDALDAIADGETDWGILARRLPRNDLPHVLAEVAWCLTDDELARAVMESWVMCESPESAIEREQWLEWFDTIGFRHNTASVDRPAEIVLWRGGVDPARMAWTADRQLAEWFRDRYPGGRLWKATVPGHHLLAVYDGIRDGGGGESEYVVNPDGLHYIVV